MMTLEAPTNQICALFSGRYWHQNLSELSVKAVLLTNREYTTLPEPGRIACLIYTCNLECRREHS